MGSVNLFHGRVDKGRFCWDPRGARTSNGPAVGYVRPHDMELQREAVGDALEVVVQHVQCVGPVVHVDLRRQMTGEVLEAQLTKEHFHRLNLKIGEAVFVRPRHLQVFGAPY